MQFKYMRNIFKLRITKTCCKEGQYSFKVFFKNLDDIWKKNTHATIAVPFSGFQPPLWIVFLWSLKLSAGHSPEQD